MLTSIWFGVCILLTMCRFFHYMNSVLKQKTESDCAALTTLLVAAAWAVFYYISNYGCCWSHLVRSEQWTIGWN